MKKVFALGLMVVCLGMFSLGCGPKAADPAPAPPSNSGTPGTSEAAPAAPAETPAQ